MKRLCGFAVAGAVALTALLGFGGGQAFAAQVHCGDVISQDTRVDNDLIDCPGDGLVVGADDITLDLNGHTIDGQGQGNGIVAAQYHGSGPDRATIEDGTVQDFGVGIRLDGSDGTHLKRLTVSGIVAVRSRSVWIERNDVGGSIGLAFSSGLIDGNRVFHGGIFFSYGSAVIRDNRVSGSQRDGIGGGETSGSVIEENVVVESGNDGISLQSFVEGNRIARNKVVRNGGDGIEIHTILIGGVGHNEIVDNFSSGNGRDGIVLDWQAYQNVVRGNTTNRNGDDGIHVDRLEDPDYAARNTLTRNKANSNGDLGIEASSPTIDGGGNKAHGNGNPLQCLNVACK